jgi:hypothetical protein
MSTPWRGLSILKIHDRAEIRDDTGHIQERETIQPGRKQEACSLSAS